MEQQERTRLRRWAREDIRAARRLRNARDGMTGNERAWLAEYLPRLQDSARRKLALIR